MEIGIIGAGPAGIIAAGEAAKKKINNVTLLEKNDRIGKKLFITGKGRCNITNAIGIDEFFDYITTNSTFLYSSLYSFTNTDIINLLKEYGVETKVERGNRIFPKSGKSIDVINAFKKYLYDSDVNIKLNSNVTNIEYSNTLKKFKVKTTDHTYKFDKLLISTGGASYPGTGSTGDGYNYAKRFGHKIDDIKPALVPIELNNCWLDKLQGLSLKNVELSSFSKDKLIHREFGEMIFTHFGISGPIVLTTSNYIKDYIGEDIKLTLDLKPALDYQILDKRILRDFNKYSNKQVKNSLDDLLPKKIIPVVIDEWGVDPEKKVHQINKREREKLLYILKRFPLNYKSFRPLKYGIVTSGGINVNEINPSTMESKIMPNLYFAGEVINVDALTGGFNLQIAYSTGYIAGNNM